MVLSQRALSTATWSGCSVFKFNIMIFKMFFFPDMKILRAKKITKFIA